MDSELLYRLKEGDRDAFNTVYWRYSPKVYNTVLYLLNDADLAEDVVQELFLTIWESVEIYYLSLTLKPISRPSPVI